MTKHSAYSIADVRSIRQSLQSLFMMLLLGVILYCMSPVISAYSQESAEHNRITSFLLKSFSENRLPIAITKKERTALYEFYRKRYFAPLWVSAWGVNPNVFKVIKVIALAQSEGMHPKYYPMNQIDSLLSDRSPKGLAELDILVSYVVWRYSSDLYYGRFNPEHSMVSINVLNDVMRSKPKNVKRIFATYHPNLKEYGVLKRLLSQYRKLEIQGGWPKIPHYMKLQKGDKEEEVITLRKALVITGDLHRNNGEMVFDTELEKAVKKFQKRHSIDVDGVVGRYTRDALNMPLPERINQITVNMERLRWLPKTMGARYIVVNIPAFRLQAVNKEKQSLNMRVIVGRPSRETPLFSREVSHVVFNPPWGVPPRIAEKDLLPKIQSQPQFLDFSGFRLYKYQGGKSVQIDPGSVDWDAMDSERFKQYNLRQDPGSHNPLGKVKFLIPDSSFVYLHDTPEKFLFNRTERAFSSGCIRVESPKTLANFVLSGQQGWPTSKIYKTFDTQDKTKYVKVNAPPKVHVVYWTVWVDEKGNPHFSNDIYKKDASLIMAMRSFSSTNAVQLATQ